MTDFMAYVEVYQYDINRNDCQLKNLAFVYTKITSRIINDG